ncbi:L,D-transpeptidase family protein [Desulfovibrio cuneatus]|uniref:L,D-transpeptidase family protein n=1 Tax=Desulfovibrio cuneatus TaxID=159728 RepID=UPI0004153A2B|nr:L,D-transpeptidase [Desulfovibrio cuneatus]
MARYPRTRFPARRRSTKLVAAFCLLAGAMWFALWLWDKQPPTPQPALNTQATTTPAATTQARNTPESLPVPPAAPVAPVPTRAPGLPPQSTPPAAVAQPPKKLPANLPKDVAQRLQPLTEAEAYPNGPLAPKATFDRLVLKKKEHRLYAYYREKVLRVYPVALSQNPQGQRKVPGDKKTPEGIYAIRRKEDASPYHKTLELSFPNAQDLLNAQVEGRPIAGPVGIHGLTKDTAFLGLAHRASDWTDGGIALSNEEIDELFERTPLGVPVHLEK